MQHEVPRSCQSRLPSARAAELIDSLALLHGMRLADALIGATAIVNLDTLITAKGKHFGAVEGLDFIRRRGSSRVFR